MKIKYLYLNLDTEQYVETEMDLITQVGKGGAIGKYPHYPKGVLVAASRNHFTEVQANMVAKRIANRTAMPQDCFSDPCSTKEFC